MRSSGDPDFPDPKPGGGFPGASLPTGPAAQTAQAKCRRLLANAGAGPPFSEQALVQLRGIAVCMRAHGVPQFPDPVRASANAIESHRNATGGAHVADYRGVLLAFPVTIDRLSPAFEQAAAACGGSFLDRN